VPSRGFSLEANETNEEQKANCIEAKSLFFDSVRFRVTTTTANRRRVPAANTLSALTMRRSTRSSQRTESDPEIQSLTGDQGSQPDPEQDTDLGPSQRQPAAPKDASVSLKNIQCTTFDGTVQDNDFDPGASVWWSEFQDQVDTAQLLSGQQWSDRLKRAALGQFLKGSAKAHYRSFVQAHRDATFEETGEDLVRRFRPLITTTEIVNRVVTERKRPEETYSEFADRLSSMVESIDGGMANPVNGRHALTGFVKNAWPKYTQFLMGKISLRTSDPIRELARAVDELSAIADSDGKMRNSKRPRFNRERKDTNSRDSAGHAHAVTIERKQKKPMSKKRAIQVLCLR
jgi:hypothetical protein